MNVERLQKLADWLRRLPKEKFDFGTLVNHAEKPGCGTVACAMGWTPAVFPDLVEWGKWGIRMPKLDDDFGEFQYWEDVAEELFGIDPHEATHLFSPGEQHMLHLEDVPDTATPSEVADLIEAYIKLKS